MLDGYSSVINVVPLVFAMAFAILFGIFCSIAFEKYQRNKRYRSSISGVRAGDYLGSSNFGEVLSDKREVRNLGAINVKVVQLLLKETWRISVGGSKLDLPGIFLRCVDFENTCKKAGLKDAVSLAAVCNLRVKGAFALGAGGLIFGLCFSNMLGVLLFVVGVVAGWRAPMAAMRNLVAFRAKELERHLPEMLDVVAIGMRSGLSFDRSLEIYSQRFSTMLSAEMASAQRQWQSGLARRDAALREVAATYESDVLSRAVESIVRSLRFGSSMIEGLEAAARDARISYRTARQEEVAKAPVKMMVPTGVLILPAMLILVLGPVLLELIGGGI